MEHRLCVSTGNSSVTVEFFKESSLDMQCCLSKTGFHKNL